MAEPDLERIERQGWALAAAVTVSVVGVIWLATSGRLPAEVVPSVPDDVLEATPHVNAAFVSTALATLLVGYQAARRRQIRRHAASMAVTATLFFGFLSLYLLRLTNEGLTEFQGPEAIYSYVYLPVLVVHMVLAGVAVPLVVFALYVGARAPVDSVGDSTHPRVGRIAVPLWGVSFVLGDVVYLFLHHLY